MSLRAYIILMIIATIACYLGFFAVLFFFDPNMGGIWTLILFYLSILLVLIGTFSLLGLGFRIFFTKNKLIFNKVITSFRQAFWFALVIVISLHLKSLDLLLWYNVILLIFAFSLIELFFISYQSKERVNI